jgi:hypothetical protein
MKVSIKRCIPVLLFFILPGLGLNAQTYRAPSDSVQQALAADEELNYVIDLSTPDPSPWQKLWLFLNQLYQNLFSVNGNAKGLGYFVIALAVAAVAFALYKLVQMDKSGLFKEKDQNAKAYRLREENLHALNFDAEIAAATQKKNYRLVVRLYYLKVLHLLNEQKQIEVKAGKTNHHYSYEIEDAAVLHSFNKLSRLFDYAWYGGFPVKEITAQTCRQEAEKLQSLF